MAVKKIETLNKHQNPATNENEFDIENYMNVNWDKIKEVVDNNADELTTTQGKVTTLETDNTKNKQDISDIKSEQESQNDLLQRTQSALINITTEKSSNINVKDSSDLNAKVDVFGISEQETREGYNKFDYDTIEGLAGSTIKTSVDGLNVYKRTSSNQNIWPLFNLNDVLEDGKAYTMCFDIWADAQTSFNNQRFYVNTTTETTHNLSNITTAKQRLIANFTYTKNDSNAIIHIYPTTSETNNFYIANVMLLEGTFTSENIPNYEQYGASPSPEYPSEIENVTGDIDITVCNKNLFTGFTKGKGLNGTTGEETTNSTGAVSNFIEVGFSKNSNYYLSGLTNTLNSYIAAYNKNKEFLGRIGANAQTNISFNKDSFTLYSAEGDIAFVRVTQYEIITSTGTIDDIDDLNVQLEANNVATDFIAHEEQLITFPLAEGQKLYDGDYLANDGIHHVRDVYTFKAVTSLASYNNNRFGTNVSAVNSVNTANILSDKIVGSDSTKENTGYITGGGETIVIYGNPADTVKSFNERFVGTKIEYPLAKEKIEAYTPEQQEAYNKLQNVLSYYNETNVFTDKAQLVFKYIADTKTYVDNQYNALANQVLELAGGN